MTIVICECQTIILNVECYLTKYACIIIKNVAFSEMAGGETPAAIHSGSPSIHSVPQLSFLLRTTAITWFTNANASINNIIKFQKDSSSLIMNIFEMHSKFEDVCNILLSLIFDVCAHESDMLNCNSSRTTCSLSDCLHGKKSDLICLVSYEGITRILVFTIVSITVLLALGRLGAKCFRNDGTNLILGNCQQQDNHRHTLEAFRSLNKICSRASTIKKLENCKEHKELMMGSENDVHISIGFNKPTFVFLSDKIKYSVTILKFNKNKSNFDFKS